MVEVFILNYNGAAFLERALDSIFRQTQPLVRVILSDNASTDESIGIALKFKSRGLEIKRRQPGTGDLFTHANLCLAEARAPYVAIFHNDDIYEPEILGRQVQFLERHPELGGVLTAGLAIDEKDRELWPLRPPAEIQTPILDGPQVYRWIMRHGSSFLICPSALFRRTALVKLGGFRPEFPNSADLELFLRLMFMNGSDCAGLGYLNDPLIRYRLSSGQTSAQYLRGRTSLSDFYSVMDLYQEQATPSLEDLSAFEALKRLDLLQVGMNQLQITGQIEPVLEQIRWWRNSDHQRFLENLGFVDRLKIRLTILAQPVFRGPGGRWFVAFLNRQLDPRTGFVLRWMLSWKRSRG